MLLCDPVETQSTTVLRFAKEINWIYKIIHDREKSVSPINSVSHVKVNATHNILSILCCIKSSKLVEQMFLISLIRVQFIAQGPNTDNLAP